MTDNTQELDYTHPDEMPTVEHRPSPNSDLRGMIVHFTSEMLDNPDDNGIYPTTNFYNDLEEAILDWHNKQIERPEPYEFSYLVKCSRCGHENRGEAMTPPTLDYLVEQRNKLKED